MSSSREPLGSLSTNCLPSTSTTPPPKPVYPIFLSRRSASKRPSTIIIDATGDENNEYQWSDNETQRERKRSKTSGNHFTAEKSNHDSRHSSISDYFTSKASLRGSSTSQLPKPVPERHDPNVWRRSRARLGCGRAVPNNCVQSTPSMLPYMFTQTHTHPDPRIPPSTMVLPSVDSPTGRQREFDPALVIAFSEGSKRYTAREARDSGNKRLLAIGGEEGGIRIVDVDHAPGSSDTTDYWWRAHGNAVFDLKWTSNDTRLLSASADLSLRLFDLGSGNPRALATMRGHTSSIKSTAILDQGHVGSGSGSSVIASGGRDGNINIYDLRCPGRGGEGARSEGTRRSSRSRTTARTEDFGGQELEPVLTLRQPHNATSTRRSSTEARSSSRTITSLVSLQTMPGILASGGTYDGIVKLWDIRLPGSTSSLRPKYTPYGVLPDPTTAGDNPSCRPRSVNALCENPTTGDLYALCGDSQVHVLRPSAATRGSVVATASTAILPQKYVHPDLLMRSFYIRMSLSPDGRYLACGSSHGGVMTWDTHASNLAHPRVQAARFPLPRTGLVATPEVIAVDWGKDIMAASSDDSLTRLWRVDYDIAQRLHLGDVGLRSAWSGLQ